MVASRGPVVAVNDFDADKIRNPDRRHEAEVDVPGLGRIALMTIGRVCLVTVLDAVKRVIGADQSEVRKRGQDARVPFARRLARVEIDTEPSTFAPTTARPRFARGFNFARWYGVLSEPNAMPFRAFTRWVTNGPINGSTSAGLHSCRKTMAGEKDASSARRVLSDP
jgi:hypothetical protein